MTDTAMTVRLRPGARLEIADPDRWVDDPQALTQFRELVDERLAVHVTLGRPISPAALAALGIALGQPTGPYADRPGGLPGFGFISDLVEGPRAADTPERVPAWIEDLHFDGDAAYTVQASLHGEPLSANRFVDMAAVYAELPNDMKRTVTGRMALHGPLPPTNRPLAEARPLDATRARRRPLVVRHPRTGRAVLRPPKHPQAYVEGLPEEEGRALVTELWDRARASPSSFEARLEPGQMLVWDNLGAAHTNPAFTERLGRRSWFFNLPGEGAELAGYQA